MITRISQEDTVAAINGTDDLKVFVFSSLAAKHGTIGSYDATLGQYVTYEAGWEPFTLAGDTGQWYELTTDTTALFNNLMEILEDTACGPPSQ